MSEVNDTSMFFPTPKKIHMTYSSHCFSSCYPCSRDKKIKVVDGTLATVVGQGKFVFNFGSHIKICVICSKTFS